MDTHELIDLIKQATIDVFNQIQPPPQPFFSVGEYVAIGVAVLATVASICIGFYTNHVNKKINQKVIDANEKINQNVINANEKINQSVIVANEKINAANIDANIVAKARIEWIQSVRKSTAEFLDVCHAYINLGTSSTEKTLNAVLEKKILFILYFGPDVGEVDLHDIETNKGKNELLVQFINNICLDLAYYHDNIISAKNTKEEMNRCYKCQNFYNRFHEDEKQYYERPTIEPCPRDEYGTPFNHDDCDERKKVNEAEIKKFENFNHGLILRIHELSEIMRKYLKIEWNVAKERTR